MAKKIVLGMLVLLVAAMGVAGQAAIITNGSFETMVIGPSGTSFDMHGYAGDGTFAGWTLSSGNRVGVCPSLRYWNTMGNNLAIPDGLRAAFMQVSGTSKAWVEQDVFLSAGTYTLSYYESVRSYSDQPYLIVTLSDQTLDSHLVQGPSQGLTSYTLRNVNFTVSSNGTYALKFTNDASQCQGSVGEATVLLDNIQIVPEPVSMILLGLGGLFLKKRDK